MSVRNLMRENIRTLEPYKCARDEAGPDLSVYLDANENYAPLDDCEGINRYPDSANRSIIRAASSAFGLPEDMIAAGNGSDELIDVLFRIFCTPGKDCVLVFPPTYGEYAVLASINDVRVISCPLNEDFSICESEAESMIRQYRPKLTFFCSPNNPSGNLLDKNAILRLASINEGISVVDQAYIDFAMQGAFTPEDVKANERIVVLRTMSKAWAAAGCRIGIMMAASEILSAFYDVKYPYNISRPAAEEAVKVLSRTASFTERVAAITANRDYLMESLCRIDGVLDVRRSDANFFLVQFAHPGYVYRELKKKGIAVRDRSSQLHCGGCLRITVGSRSECDSLITALEEILAGGKV